MFIKTVKHFMLLCIGLSVPGKLYAVRDTLKVMTWNVLYYGDRPACQAPHDTLHRYLQTVVAYTQPDVLGLVKMESYPLFAGDNAGTAPAGFPDSILRFALDAAFAGRYAWCATTNDARSGDMQVLFYNQQKLGYLGMVASYVNINDFNTFKFYYKSPLLATGHDTVFLYITLNHTESGGGSGSIATRTVQVNGTMNQLQTVFTTLPNLVNMGDFNFRYSAEGGYQRLVNPTNAAFRMYDPPFGIDGTYTYPADWDASPSTYARSLTTSTRLSNIPNSCGTTGGGKSWYDHIFVSAQLLDNSAGLRYLPGSYTTVGNDGLRTGKNINDAPTNTSAPAAVIDALFRMSNKYPVMVSLEVDDAFTAVSDLSARGSGVRLTNPVSDQLAIYLPATFMHQPLTVSCRNMVGMQVWQRNIVVGSERETLPFAGASGQYIITIYNGPDVLVQQLVYKQ